jgi:pyruvate ferredoxin oxidoreductase gamma subunit
MIEVRVHGRGGQGVVTAAALLSIAAFLDGLEAQAFPSFGSERMGAPIVAYCRISQTPIRLREPVSEPDVIVVADPTLLHHLDVFAGLRPDGYVLVNSNRTFHELGIDELAQSHEPSHLVSVAASEIATEHLGRPMANVALIGAFAAMTGAVSLAGVERAAREWLKPAAVAANIAAAREAYHRVEREYVHA